MTDTTQIEFENGTLWVKFKAIPPPEDEEFTSHRVVEVRLDSEEGCLVTWLYTEFDEVRDAIDSRITTELN